MEGLERYRLGKKMSEKTAYAAVWLDDYDLTFGFPNLDELRSSGPLQAYVAELEKAKEEQTRGGRV